jgi:2-amino-4-hydroxy-6-hydroxymethyldihydropteridine diphosphokinase
MDAMEPVEAFVALGSNLGNSLDIIQQAFGRLQELSQTPVRHSSIWRSAPVDCPPGSPDFINAVAGLTPNHGETPESLLVKLKALEVEFGRRPKMVVNEPRPLDLDLIAFGGELRESSQVILPHPRAHVRAFVLLPLSEIAPELILPGQTESVFQLSSRILDGTLSRLS